MRKGWTLTETLVTIGVMGILLALVGELTLWALRAGAALEAEAQERRYAVKAMEEMLSLLNRGGKVIVAPNGFSLPERTVSVTSKGGQVIVREGEKERSLLPEGLTARLELVEEKPCLLRLSLHIRGIKGTQSWQTKVFLPPWRRWE